MNERSESTATDPQQSSVIAQRLNSNARFLAERPIMKLYKVSLQGFCDNPIGSAMVVADDPTAAYEMVRAWLDEKDWGFSKDRELYSVELIADTYEYTDAPSRLFLQNS